MASSEIATRVPRRATATDLFDKLVAFPSLVSHPNLTIEILLLREDHIRAARPVTSRRRTRDPGERRLVDVVDPGRRELGGERIAVVLRVAPRTREPAHVDQQLDLRRRQQSGQLVERAGRVADGEEGARR